MDLSISLSYHYLLQSIADFEKVVSKYTNFFFIHFSFPLLQLSNFIINVNNYPSKIPCINKILEAYRFTHLFQLSQYFLHEKDFSVILVHLPIFVLNYIGSLVYVHLRIVRNLNTRYNLLFFFNMYSSNIRKFLIFEETNQKII